MKKFMYSQHDKVANFFNIIQVSDLEPESFAENLSRSIQLCKDPSKLTMIADCELVAIGSYDDETMKFDLFDEPKVILECSSLVSRQIEIYGKSTN